MILLLDNYDSFTYNLLHYIEQVTDEKVVVKRNNEVSLNEVDSFSSIVLSPGPGLPSDAGIMNELIKKFSSTKPILGICLGLQAIGEVYGGRLLNLDKVLHGVQRKIKVINSNDRIFKDIPSSFITGHYHSWVINKIGLPDELEVTAMDDTEHIMAISHRTHPVSGVQFHPESILTENGLKLISNWIEFVTAWNERKITSFTR